MKILRFKILLSVILLFFVNTIFSQISEDKTLYKNSVNMSFLYAKHINYEYFNVNGNFVNSHSFPVSSFSFKRHFHLFNRLSLGIGIGGKYEKLTYKYGYSKEGLKTSKFPNFKSSTHKFYIELPIQFTYHIPFGYQNKNEIFINLGYNYSRKISYDWDAIIDYVKEDSVNRLFIFQEAIFGEAYSNSNQHYIFSGIGFTFNERYKLLFELYFNPIENKLATYRVENANDTIYNNTYMVGDIYKSRFYGGLSFSFHFNFRKKIISLVL